MSDPCSCVLSAPEPILSVMSSSTRAEHLMIALPCRDDVRAQAVSHLFLCMLNASLYWKGLWEGDVPLTFFFQHRVHILEARTAAVEHARASDVDWILWLDDDMTPPPDLLQRLHQTGKRFVGAVAYRRDPPHLPCVFRRAGDVIEPFDPDPSAGLVEADMTGFACLLMHCSVWEDVWTRTDGRPFQYRVGAGEDIYFCAQAGAAGHQLYIVPDLVVGHVAEVIIGAEQRRPYL